MKVTILLCLAVIYYTTVASAWSPGKDLLDKIKLEIDKSVGESKSKLEKGKQEVEDLTAKFSTQKNDVYYKDTEPKLKEIINKAKEQYREAERKALMQNISVESCYEEMTSLYMEISTIAYQVQKCLNKTADKEDKKLNKTMASYEIITKSLDTLQASADQCVTSTDNMLEVAAAMICIKPVAFNTYLTTRKADKLAKEFEKIKLVLADLTTKLTNCSKQATINELSKNTVGETVKECIELKIEENDLETTAAPAQTEEPAQTDVPTEETA